MTNEGACPIEIQGFVPEAKQWHTVVPFVGPHSRLVLPFETLWLPRNMTMRSVAPGTNDEIEVHGVLGDGLAIVQR